MIEPLYKADDRRYDCGMDYARCGRSGILLSRISLGMWHNFGEVDPLSRSKEIMHYAFDHGIVSFDLANNYGPGYGTAEETFGYLFAKSFRPYRDEMFISSKAGFDMWPGPYGNYGSRKYLMASIDQSLRRMGLDYVDVFYSHRYDPDTPAEETLQALCDIVRSGKALYAGISNWPLEATAFAASYLRGHDTPCLVYQGRYNIFDRAIDGEGILAKAADEGMGVVAFSPLAQGLLTDKYIAGVPADSRAAKGKFLTAAQITPVLVDKIKALNDIAAARGQSLAQMAVAWTLRDPRVTSAIVGARSVAQLADLLPAVSNCTFTPDQLSAIDTICAR